MQPTNEVIMERWVVRSAIQQNGGASWGRVLEACRQAGRQASFPEGSHSSAKVEGGAGLLISIFPSKIGGCLVCLKAKKIMVLEQ